MTLAFLPSDALERSTVVEPLVAWRAWTLSTDRRSGALLRPIAGRANPWPRRRPARATCWWPQFHDSPDELCRCGLHAVTQERLLRWTRSPAVIGTVALWGRVIEHENGFRGEFGYPQRLRLVCHVCLWRYGLHQAEPDVVARMERGRLVPLCSDHLALSERCGLRFRSVAPASDVHGALLSEYAVDPLPVRERELRLSA
jgi:hypothetical protein